VLLVVGRMLYFEVARDLPAVPVKNPTAQINAKKTTATRPKKSGINDSDFSYYEPRATKVFAPAKLDKLCQEARKNPVGVRVLGYEHGDIDIWAGYLGFAGNRQFRNWLISQKCKSTI
jgi:hypothetical protein